jgi:hypothetical protein
MHILQDLGIGGRPLPMCPRRRHRADLLLQMLIFCSKFVCKLHLSIYLQRFLSSKIFLINYKNIFS